MWKSWLKTQHSENKDHGTRSHHFIANRETVETVDDFIWGGSKIAADSDCSHEIKRRLLLRRKVMTNLDSIFKSRYITLPTKVHLVKAMVFPVVMYGCESGTVKKAEHRRIDAFELWCWRRLLRVTWTARRSNHSEGDQPWDFFGRNYAKAETPVLWPPHVWTERLWLYGSQQTGKFFKRWEYQTTLPVSWETCMQVKKQQLELNMEQQTGS